MSKSYLLKLNASPQLLYKYGVENITKQLLPSIFRQSFPSRSSSSFVLAPPSVFFSDIHASPFYIKLLNDTENAELLYEKVVSQFLETGAFSYTKEYLDLIESLKKRRLELLNNYPILGHARYISNREAKDRFHFLSVGRVGTGLNHFLNMAKIELFLEKRCQKELSPVNGIGFAYNKDETLSICTDDEELFPAIRLIENTINRSVIGGKRRTAPFHINPMFASVRLKNEQVRCDLRVVVDYPNGADLDEELYALLPDLSRQTDARSADIFLENADTGLVERLVQPCAKKGYLRDVTKNKGGSLIDISKSAFKIPEQEEQ